MKPQDLNLLVVFDAIMTEGSITRAADRLAMTQPAVSNAVSRMRTAWRDELFVKKGRNIQPTQRAVALWQQVQDPLKSLDQAIAPGGFEPETSQRIFRVSATDGVIDLVWPALRQVIEREAPGIAVHVLPYNIINGEALLENAEVDMVLAVQGMLSSDSTNSQYLYDSTYRCAMRKGHPLAKPDLSIEEFAAADHLLVSLSGDTVGFTDRELAQQGLKRRIAMTLNHFHGIPPLLEASDLIAVVPTLVVEDAMVAGRLAVTHSPVTLQDSRLYAFWHRRQDRDEGLAWLLSVLNRLLRARAAAHERVLRRHAYR